MRYRRRQKQGIEVDRIKQAQLHESLRFRLPNPIPTLLIIFDPESLIILIATGLCLACFYAISTGAASTFGDVYGFNDIKIALIFIPIAGGGVVAALTTGKIIDWNYRRYARKRGIKIVKGVRQDLSEFPIERARMEVAIPMSTLTAVLVIGYGWAIDQKVSLAGPVILLFVVSLPTVQGWVEGLQVLHAACSVSLSPKREFCSSLETSKTDFGEKFRWDFQQLRRIRHTMC